MRKYLETIVTVVLISVCVFIPLIVSAINGYDIDVLKEMLTYGYLTLVGTGLIIYICLSKGRYL